MSVPGHRDDIEGFSMRDCVAIRDHVLKIAKLIEHVSNINHFICLHDDDAIAVLVSRDVLIHFKNVRAKRESVVVEVELRVIRVIVDSGTLVTAVEVREDEDEAKVTNGVDRTEEEVSVVIDSNHESAAGNLHFILVLRHNGFGAVVTEDGQDQRGCESVSHVVE